MTPIEEKLRQRLSGNKTISLREWMTVCLFDEAHGYYRKKAAIGADGDFTTAPEISQMFGELLGLFLVDYWQRLQKPAPFILLEMGPGRGTLMADALRAAQKTSPDFVAAARIFLLEVNETLQKEQRQKLSAYQPVWIERLSQLPDDATPVLIIANEFLDALPIAQFEKRQGLWQERVITLSNEKFSIALDGKDHHDQIAPALLDAPDGAIAETNPETAEIVKAVGQLIDQRGGIALLIDYGYRGPALGDTLQALRHHEKISPFEHMGDADLTAHVDFGAIKRIVQQTSKNIVAHGPMPQGELLDRLGIGARVAKLAGQNSKVTQDAERLTAPQQMGRLFQALTITRKSAPLPAAFDEQMKMEAASLAVLPHIRHGFFMRLGGVSEGIYQSLNCGLGSMDQDDRVMQNRARAAATLGMAGMPVVTCRQCHSKTVITVTKPFATGEVPQADGLVTNVPRLIIGALAADCVPVLFADSVAGVIGACHAGWRGALAGITDETIAAMEKLGARRKDIVAAIGPCIHQPSYEVGPEFPKAFLDQTQNNQRFFVPSTKEGHLMFDLPGYVMARLMAAGVAGVSPSPADTYSEQQRFFSYRYNTHQGASEYGRNLSAIALF